MKNRRNNIIFILYILLLFSQFLNNSCFSQSIKAKNNYSYEDKSHIFQKLPADFEYNVVRCILKDYKGYMWFGTSDGLVRYDGVNLFVYEYNPDSPNNSISHNTINAIIEDKNNNLWIGTLNGINKYNREKDNFQGADSIDGKINPLNYSCISYLCLGKGSELLVGTFGYGFNIYDLKKNTLEHYVNNQKDAKSISSNRVSCIAFDKDNNLWMGTQKGLNLFCGKGKGFRRFYNHPDNPNSLSSNHVLRMVLDNEKNLWISTLQGELNKLVSHNNEFSFQRLKIETRNNFNNSILSLFPDKYGNLWFGTENGGLNRYNLKSGIIDVFQNSDGNEFGLGSNFICSIYGDDQDRIWIGTSSKGIYVMDKKYSKFELYQKNSVDKLWLTNNDVKGFAEDRQGKIWIATDGGGICRFHPETRRFDKIICNNENNRQIANNAVQCIICDNDNTLWIGTWGGGIDHLNSEGKRIRNYKIKNSKGVVYNNVTVLYQDKTGKIWAGSSGSSMFLYDPKSDDFISMSCANDTTVISSTSYITSILLDSHNTMWIGTLNGVVNLSSVKRNSCNCYSFLPANGNLLMKRYNDEVIFEDSKGRVWFGTSDRGLNLFCRKDSSFKVFQKKDGLPSNLIKGITEDFDGNLWISTDKGLSRFNVEKRIFTNFTKEDGLNSNEFHVRSCIRTKKGEFFFGGENGFNIFRPENISKNLFKPPVYLSNLKINNKEVAVDSKDSPLKRQLSESKEIILNYNQSSFTIDFVALNYTHASRNQYSYKLEGFDKEWNNIGTNRSASYTNIMPGKYLFIVRGSNNDGIWSDKAASLIIIIKPPFWKTWWAILIYAFLLIVVAYASLKIWNKQLYIKNQLKLEISAREKERELNSLNLQFFTNISHEFRTPLSLIIAPLEKLLSSAGTSISDQLMIIYRNAVRLLQLTNNLMDLRKLEDGMTNLKVSNGDIVNFVTKISADFKISSLTRNIDFAVECKENSIIGWFDSEKLEIIILNLLSNAFKYTMDNGKIKVIVDKLSASEAELKYSNKKITFSGNYIEICVIDSGLGIYPNELPYIFDKFYRAKSSEIKKNTGTGIGLALTKGLVDLHHGFIIAESKPGVETCFTIAIPIEYSSYSAKEILQDQVIYSKKSIPEQLVSPEKPVPVDVNINESAEILIVEDNDELRSFLYAELGNEFKVSIAENGKKGIELAQTNIPELIVSDILMPECSGIELCNTVKTDVRTCHIPVILLSAKTTVEDQIEGIETGADAYITKPFNFQYLITTIKQLIKSRRELYNHFKNDIYILPNKVSEKETNQKFLQETIDYIVENLTNNNLSVDDLANALKLNRSNVYRKIKSITGLTIIEFIRIIRLKEAIKLIETKQYSISEIAYKTGFTSPSYFTKSFKAQYGKTPTDFFEN